MRIGIDGRVLQDHFTGIGRYAFSLVRALTRFASYDDFVLFVDQSASNSRWDLSALHAPNLTVVTIDAPLFSLAGQWRAAQSMNSERLDLLHAPYFLTPLGLKVPLVLTVHDAIPLRFPSSLPSRLAQLTYRPLLIRATKQALRIIAVSRWVATELDTLRIVDYERVTIVHEAADDLPAACCSNPAIKLPDRPYFLALGIDKALKNLPFLVEAYARSNASTPLVLVGPLDRRFSRTREVVARYGVEGRVFQIGAVPERNLSAVYRGAIAFLWPSRAEGFGLPPLEAMSHGVPVVSSSASAMPEVLGAAALMVAPDDLAGWQRAIQTMEADSQTRAKLANAGRERAKLFSWEKTARETHAVYLEAHASIGQKRP